MKEEWKRRLKKAKFVITIIILAGVVIHLLLVYDAAKSLEITGKNITGLSPTYRKIDEYEVKFVLTFKNPKSTPIEVDYIHYEVTKLSKLPSMISMCLLLPLCRSPTINGGENVTE